ncbi:DNA-3-methyladenine glycosylase I [[Mycoplasma] testudinis]|uniref:DNA-3-methyladenine glycosylase I n=1 Tax=[Mycoplasma] testudinis TaxID=33924 RepID=UPI00069716EB|nr:DNA-3-methyladenine glycosylase I [[Mycoplasma] testudinis]
MINTKKPPQLQRCSWARSVYYIDHHDNFWGIPWKTEHELFEYLCLESQAAGLSFDLVLSKKKYYEKAFFNFKPEKIIEIKHGDIKKMMSNTGLIRYEKKLISIVNNAKAYLNLKQEKITLQDLVYQSKKVFIQGHNKPGTVVNNFAKDLSAKLKKYGFTFVGPITIFSYLQAVGVYDDHQPQCDWYYLKKKMRIKNN